MFGTGLWVCSLAVPNPKRGSGKTVYKSLSQQDQFNQIDDTILCLQH